MELIWTIYNTDTFNTGLERIVEHLIDNGADLNAVNKLNNNSALIVAIQSGESHAKKQ